jgi:hypothetical protein
MSPRIAALLMFGWAVLAAAQLWDGRLDPFHNRHFWFGILAIIFAVMYGYRWKKLTQAAKADQSEQK